MWSDARADDRWRELERLAASDISMQDRFSAVQGVEDVRAHLDAVHQHMPGFVLRREGEVQQCQGQVLVNWKAFAKTGEPRGAGTNIFLLGADGRIQSVTGFWTG
jgi:hypothetical protein